MKTLIPFRFFKEQAFKSYRLIFICALVGLAPSLKSCDDFTETPMPIMELSTVAVFEDLTTATAAVANIYAQIRDNGMLTGKTTGLSKEMGLYADELTWYGNTTQASANFYNNTLMSTHATVGTWWNNAYSQIYAANAVIEGVDKSDKLLAVDKERLIGQAIFARALVHLYLVQLYGAVPYVTVTDYTINKTVKRLPEAEVYDKIIADLESAAALLPTEYTNPNRVLPNSYVAHALLARTYLYAGKWAEASNSASAVLNNTELYVWDEELNNVFLKGSTTTIWQYGARTSTRNTDDGSTFIFNAAPPNSVALTSQQMVAFESGDQRKSKWTRARIKEDLTFYHAYKYKKAGGDTPQTECTVVLRMAEQYLIRAEARARQGELIGAIEDLNKVRSRAGLANTTAVTAPALLQAILHERQVELFTEFGHRFMDLKRFGALDTALEYKGDWSATEQYLPLPQTELNLNPNLGSQNQGY
ncbi:RagB/SusD family nutrient uptake outer membrane protein [Flavobacterium sp. SM2513]|uniref:RagB/SusD family nutrient uptake outer membrane protein n=1 Tax=Flavobacterium sp. SM2513 TaxID=3424766 RepID=UPI003D7F49B4